MNAVAERSHVYDIEKYAPPQTFTELLLRSPDIKLAGLPTITPDGTSEFTTSPYSALKLSEKDALNRALDLLASEIPNSHIEYFKPHLATIFLENDDPKSAIRVGRVSGVISSESGDSHKGNISYYPDPAVANLVSRFLRISFDGHTRIVYPKSNDFQILLNRVCPADLDEERIERLEHRLEELEDSYRKSIAWRVPGA